MRFRFSPKLMAVVAVATVFAGSALAQFQAEFSGTLLQDVTDSRALFGNGAAWGNEYLGDIAAGVYNEQFTVPFGNGVSDFQGVHYTLFANYEPIGTSDGGVVIAIDTFFANTVLQEGLTFDDVFTGMTEEQLSTAIAAQDTQTISQFYAANQDWFPTVSLEDPTATLVRFSSGQLAGSIAILDPVPEPASIAALGLGALAMLRKRRKK